MPAVISTQTVDLLRARQLIAAALSAALADPRSPASRQPRGDRTGAIGDAWDYIKAARPPVSDDELGLGELRPDAPPVTPLLAWLKLDHQARAQAHQAVFGLVTSQLCPPFETEYCHWKDPTYRAQQLADVAGFYGAFGVEPSSDTPERHDHVSLELEFVALLLWKQQAAAGEPGPVGQSHRHVCRQAHRQFVRDHVAWWMPTFGKCLHGRIKQLLNDDADSPLRRRLTALTGVARLLRAWVAVERLCSGVEPTTQVIAPQVDADPAEPMTCAECGGAPLALPATTLSVKGQPVDETTACGQAR